MKKLFIIFVGAILFSITAIYGQEPVPILDTAKNPVKQDDPEVENTPPDAANYLRGMVKIVPTDLPAPVKRTLQSGSQYYGWEKATVYKHKSDNTYLVELPQGESKRVFKFDKTGKPLLE